MKDNLTQVKHTKSKRQQKAEPAIDSKSEANEPHLLAILFCDWANNTNDNKTNLIGTFDHVFISPDTKLTPLFFLFIRLIGVADDPVVIRVIDPEGTIGLEGVIEPGEQKPIENNPAYIQVIIRMQFEVDSAGPYWFNVSYRDKTLGSAPLTIQFLPVSDVRQEEVTDDDNPNE